MRATQQRTGTECRDDRCILSIDCGTQSVRGLVFDCNGHILAKHKVEFEPYVSPVPGTQNTRPATSGETPAWPFSH